MSPAINRPGWKRPIKYGADVLILDLEDSVPDNEKEAARPLVKAALKSLSEQGQICNVRVNGFATGLTFDDLDAVICPELNGVALPKVETVDEMKALDTMLDPFGEKTQISSRERSRLPWA